MAKNMTGYFYALKDQPDKTCIQMNSPIFPVEVDGVEVSDTYFTMCPFCYHNITFLSTMGNYGLKCDKCGGQLWGPMWGIDIT